jgi:hypothetical protein
VKNDLHPKIMEPADHEKTFDVQFQGIFR